MSHRQMGSFCIHHKQLDIHCINCDVLFLYKNGYKEEQVSKMTNREIFKQVDIILERQELLKKLYPQKILHLFEQLEITAEVIMNITEWIRSQTDLWENMEIKIDTNNREVSLFDCDNHVMISTKPFSYFEGE